MGFWIFMLIIDMLIPITMIGFGSYFVKSGGPQEINTLFGYRTSMSMKNKDTWAFAHKYCGKLWRLIGWVILFPSVGCMLFVADKDIGVTGLIGGIISGCQLVFLIFPIVFT
ncbi:MAG: SdpI family protein, partial [Oscillospiraceae bacterium]|nr:SdpI family protein [Oscillospiraceae bacterium]